MKSKTPISWFLAILINDCLLYQEDFLQSGMTSIEVVIQIYSEYFLRKLSENFKKFFLFIVMERIWTFWKLFSIVALSIRESILAHCCVSYGNQSFDFLWKSNEAISLWNAIRGWSKLTVTVQAPTPQNDQIIRQFLPTNCLSVFDHFVGLVLKGLKILRMPLRDFASFWF